MSKGKILVVDADEDIRSMLEVYFTKHGYEVRTIPDADGVFDLILKTMPDIVMLEFDLSHSGDVWDLMRKLRTNNMAKYIPFIYLVEKSERRDCIYDGFDAFLADDYVAKPFDLEELKLRTQNAIQATRKPGLIDPVTNFPMGEPTEDHLQEIMRKNVEWCYIVININEFHSFAEVYGWQAGDDVIRATAAIIMDVVAQFGTLDDFIGHPRKDYFVVISHAESVDELIKTIIEKFAKEIQRHYTFLDRGRGYMLVGDEQKPLMTLSIGSASTQEHEFADIREVTELADKDRFRRSGDDVDNDSSSIPTDR